MKSIKIILLFILMGGFLSVHAQLEVIDKVAGVLIPEITKGIKTVIESSNGNKVKKDEVVELQEKVKSATDKMVAEIDGDVANISALNELFFITGQLFDDIGSMKTLAKEDLLESIISTGSHKLYIETAVAFSRSWRQLEQKKDKLVSLSENASSGSVQDDIAQYVSILDENLIDLESTLKLEKYPSSSMDMPTAKAYVENMLRSEEYIDDIFDAVKAINVQLSARIKSLKKSLEDAKSDVEEITNSDK